MLMKLLMNLKALLWFRVQLTNQCKIIWRKYGSKSAKRKYDIGDLNDANSQINNLLQPLKMRTLDAARLESMATRNGYEPFQKCFRSIFREGW